MTEEMSGKGLWIAVVTLFPELVRSLSSAGVLSRAVASGRLHIEVFNPRDFANDRHRSVDDRPYGGGPGMVMMVEPLMAAIEAAQAAARGATGSAAHVICLSPQGRALDQQRVVELVGTKSMILVAGRYEGIDERVTKLAVDEELSIGDYVLTGGELAAMVLVDAMSRFLPGTLGNDASVCEESHLDGRLDYPHYTRPEEIRGLPVPEILLSGDHQAVEKWRRKESLKRTWARRPDLLTKRGLSDEEYELLGDDFPDT